MRLPPLITVALLGRRVVLRVGAAEKEGVVVALSPRKTVTLKPVGTRVEEGGYWRPGPGTAWTRRREEISMITVLDRVLEVSL